MKALKKTFAAVAATALMGVASVAQAGVIIDLFAGTDVQQVQTTRDVGSTSNNQFQGSDIIGGIRDLAIKKDGQVTNPDGSFASVPGVATLSAGYGYLTFSNDTGVTSTGVVTWDGSNDAAVLGKSMKTDGLGQWVDGVFKGVDLTGGGTNNQLNTTVLYSDQELAYSIEIWDIFGNGSRLSTNATKAVPDSSPEAAPYFFEWFNYDTETYDFGDDFIISIQRLGGGDIDFTNIGALQLTLTNAEGTSSIDLTIGAVNAVPEPGTLALVGAGLFGMAAFGRRRKTA